MKNIYTPADIERITAATIGDSADYDSLDPNAKAAFLERRAVFIAMVGEQVADEIESMNPGDSRVLVFAGDGICGAYALEAARELHYRGIDAYVVLFNIGNCISPDCAEARDRFRAAAGDSAIEEIIEPGPEFCMPQMNRRTIVVDGIFGSEYRKPLKGGYQAVARHINEHGARVVAIDLPSGMTTDLGVGMINRNIIHAETTLTLVGPTLAFFMPENAELIGKWRTLDVPFNEEAMDATQCTSRLIDEIAIRNVLPKRSPVANKSDLGDTIIFAGSYGMVGAAVLATRAATRSGCGRVTCHGPRCANYILQSTVPSAMFATDGGDYAIERFENPRDADGIAVGPGIGTSDATADALETFFKSCFGSRKPLVVDADALNIIARRPGMLDFIPPRSVITPHAGEFDRIFGQQNTSGTRTLMALEMARRYKIVIVLKGPHTLTVWPDGSVLVNSSGTNVLATAGSGDVLAGLLAGLIAQKMTPEVAAVAAVFVHGIAGRIAQRSSGTYGTTAEDIADAIGPAIESILNTQNSRS